MRPAQLGDYRIPSDVQRHPAGDKAVFVVSRMDLVEDRYERQLWMWNGHDIFPITDGVADNSPRWSPDGTVLAFLSKSDDPDATAQIFLRTGYDDLEPLTAFDDGVVEFGWSPDGSKIVAVVSELVDGIDTPDERLRAPRRISAPSFRYDDKSWTYNKRTHLWVVDIASGDVVKITDGDSSEASPAWSPDGATVAYLGSNDPRRWVDSLGTVSVVEVDGGASRPLTSRGEWQWVGFTDEGIPLVVGMPGEVPSLDLPQVWRVPAPGSLMPLVSVDVHITASGSMGSAGAPVATKDGTVLCVAEDRGRVSLIEVSDTTMSTIVGGKREITGFARGVDSTDILFTYSTATQPGALRRVLEGHETMLSDLNQGFAEAANLVEPTEFTYESDGATIHGWVHLPPGEGKVPLLFNIHGGPAAQYSWGFFDEFQVYVGAGYGVVSVNPRGSSGYGVEHVKVPIGRWGDEVPPDHTDLRAAPYEAAKQFERLDVDRMAIMGGSYGGLSTVMISSMDQNYVSAVAERGVYNFVSFAGTTDIPWFVQLYIGATLPDGADALWRASSLSRAHHITTPTLVIHSEHDYRCPVEQGQQLFSMLYQSGVETELLLFPEGEGHELSRSGTPKHRVERFEAILEWHGRYVPNR